MVQYHTTMKGPNTNKYPHTYGIVPRHLLNESRKAILHQNIHIVPHPASNPYDGDWTQTRNTLLCGHVHVPAAFHWALFVTWSWIKSSLHSSRISSIRCSNIVELNQKHFICYQHLWIDILNKKLLKNTHKLCIQQSAKKNQLLQLSGQDIPKFL